MAGEDPNNVIEEIRIRDLGVISEAALPLGPGFTAITGETGAGKTMVVTALGLLRGERADAATVRRGSEALWVEGTWRLDDPDAPSSTWLCVDRAAYVALTLPYGAGPDPIQAMSGVIERTMPAIPIRPGPAR